MSPMRFCLRENRVAAFSMRRSLLFHLTFSASCVFSYYNFFITASSVRNKCGALGVIYYVGTKGGDVMVKFYFIFDGFGYPLCEKHSGGLLLGVDTHLSCHACDKLEQE